MSKKSRAFHPADYLISSRLPLAKMATVTQPLYSDSDDYDEKLANYKQDLAGYQDKLFADGRKGVVILFQGMDGSGKDSMIKHVFSALNPQGVVVSTFASPSKEELAHDFLWRVHARLGPRGKISILNRSHYEEVTTVRVHHTLLENERVEVEESRQAFFKHRLQSIVDFENHLSREGYVIVKFFLHLSKREQSRKLLARLNDPDKRWKFDPTDLTDRISWNEFQIVYGNALQATSTPRAPWYVVPADDKKNSRLIVIQILLEVFRSLDLHFPDLKLSPREIAKAKAMLNAQKKSTRRTKT